MGSSEQDDFVDRVAQAVIDKIEERDRIASLVEQIAHRVIVIQKQEAALQEAATEQAANPNGNNVNAVVSAEKAEE